MLVRDLVKVEQGLVDGPLQLESGLHGLQATAPFILGRLLDVVQLDAPAALHLELHEFLGVFLLFVSRFLKVLGKAGKGHVVPVEVVGL